MHNIYYVDEIIMELVRLNTQSIQGNIVIHYCNASFLRRILDYDY